jgi:catechol 2,3-dioxygenase-like lactoylglutathione lyase family enzyme
MRPDFTGSDSGEGRRPGVTTTRISGGTNIAVKVPADRYEATVEFYRHALGFELTEQDVTDTPTLSRSCSLQFGPISLWLDRVDDAEHTEVWLELEVDDLGGARQRLAAAGIEPCDDLEPFPGVGESAHWIRDPAGVVHLLRARD